MADQPTLVGSPSHRVWSGDLGRIRSESADEAIGFLRENDPLISDMHVVSDSGCIPEADQGLALDSSPRAGTPGTHLRYQHYVGRIPVYQSGASVHIGTDGVVYQAVADVSELVNVPLSPNTA